MPIANPEIPSVEVMISPTTKKPIKFNTIQESVIKSWKRAVSPQSVSI